MLFLKYHFLKRVVFHVSPLTLLQSRCSHPPPGRPGGFVVTSKLLCSNVASSSPSIDGRYCGITTWQFFLCFLRYRMNTSARGNIMNTLSFWEFKWTYQLMENWINVKASGKLTEPSAFGEPKGYLRVDSSLHKYFFVTPTFCRDCCFCLFKLKIEGNECCYSTQFGTILLCSWLYCAIFRPSCIWREHPVYEGPKQMKPRT